MKHQVFCIFSTDVLGRVANRSASFNPPARKKAFNFAILGEGIERSELHLDSGALLEGTSYSTSIAAALAGRVLDFSRQTAPSAEIRYLENLKTFHGMEAVFCKLARDSAMGEYNCIVPISLIENSLEENRSEQRRKVCNAISMALEDLEGQ